MPHPRPVLPTGAAGAAVGLGLAAALAVAASAVVAALVAAQVRAVRRTIGDPLGRRPRSSGRYGEGEGPELRVLLLGDSTAVGLGAATRADTPGALLATGLARASGRPVRLLNVGRVGARSSVLGAQVDVALERVPDPELAVLLIGVNDVTHRVRPAEASGDLAAAVRRLRSAGAQVVVGTCPDLGAVEPIGRPLRAVARLASRRLAAAQVVAVVGAGGRTVSLGDLLGPAFAAAPHEMFARDRFHPSSAGYARVVDVVLPSACAALALAHDAAGGATEVSAVGDAAATAARTPGTEVIGAGVIGAGVIGAGVIGAAVIGAAVIGAGLGGSGSGPQGRWARVLRRP